MQPGKMVAQQYREMLLDEGPELYCRLMSELDRGYVSRLKIGRYWSETRMWYALLLDECEEEAFNSAMDSFRKQLDKAMSSVYDREVVQGDLCLYRQGPELCAGISVNDGVSRTVGHHETPDGIVCRLRPDHMHPWSPGDLVSAVGRENPRSDITWAIGYAWLLLPDQSLWISTKRETLNPIASMKTYQALRLEPVRKQQPFLTSPYR